MRRGTKDQATAALRRARVQGWTEESTACDYAVSLLFADGVEHVKAVRAVDAAWLDGFAISEPN